MFPIFLLLLLFLDFLSNITFGLPLLASNTFLDKPIWNDRVLNNGIQLRILPLGASIVLGEKSSDGNGFRYGLRNQLVDSGNPVNFIGSNQAGSMIDNECEAWPGYTIDQVAGKIELDIPSQPNLILLHAGTNDAVQNLDIQNAGKRLGDLVDRLFDAIPDVTIIASTLLPNGDPNTQKNIDVINEQIPTMVQQRQSSGKHITYVDFASSYFSLSDISDGTHPTDSGYLKMAEVWFQGMKAADAQGWKSAPARGVSDVVSGGSNTTCDKIPGIAIGPVQTQMGSGSDDGSYVHNGVQVGGFAGFQNPSIVGFNNPLPEGVFWADIDGDGIDDYVYMGSKSSYGIGVALSLGAGRLGDYLWSDFSPSCNRPGVNFADMTGDGRDDFCCIGPDGGVVCWQNLESPDPRNPSWVAMGTVKESEGFPQAQIRLADIDGDGRTDYIVFDAGTQNIYGWRNGALSNSAPAYWYPMKGVFTGLPPHDLKGWKFADLNGDGKDDLVWINDNGQVTSWINRRGYRVGLGADWVSQGITHQGSDHPVNVTFGASMGSGRADYGLVSVKGDSVYVERWENHDHGGTEVKGDGTRYCDMTGSGSDDYLFVDAKGTISLFENLHDWGHWKEWGVIYKAERARQEVHLADFDGDGKCDILLVDEISGATRVIQNGYDGDEFSFTDIGVVTGSATCPEGYGRDKHDLGVRWGDLTGDGRADFLCVKSDGSVNGYINKGVNDFVDQGLVKKSEGKERKNVRFADINGDGRFDYLYVNMTDGGVTAWYNDGWTPNTDDAFRWSSQGIVSLGGFSRGASIESGALNGLRRADYISVKPSTNEAWTWFNVCPDSEGPAPPNLPSDAPPAPTIGSGSSPSLTTTSTLATASIRTSTVTELITTTFKDSKGSTTVETITVTSQVLTTESDASSTTSDSAEWLTTATDSSGSIFTATIVITTATDSTGSTILGTFTQSPSPLSTPSDLETLTTYTEFPTGVSYVSTSVVSNTHDSSGHPVLAPWPLCWFCPPDSQGIVISASLGPGILPPMPRPPPGFSIPFPTITIGPGGNPSYGPPPEPTTPPESDASTSTSCTSETVTQITYYVSYMTDFEGSTISTSTTSTYSTNSAACSATAITTTETTVAEYPYCSAGHCLGCQERRDLYTPNDYFHSIKTSDDEEDDLSNLQNLTRIRRDIPSPEDDTARGNDAVYETANQQKIKSDDEDVAITRLVDLEMRMLNIIEPEGISSSKFERFADKNINIMVEKLTGCTVVAVVSQRGAWVSHLWESPGFLKNSNFQQDVLNYLMTGRPGEAGTMPLLSVVQDYFPVEAGTRIFIMTPAVTARDIRKDTPIDQIESSLEQPEPVAQYGPGSHPDRLTPLEARLRQLMPNVPIDRFIYRKRSEEVVLGRLEARLRAGGAAVIVYSNNQVFDWQPPLPPPPQIPDEPKVLDPPQKARWACYMQRRLMGSDTWDATPEQLGPAGSPDSIEPTATQPEPTTDSSSTLATTTEPPSTPVTSADPLPTSATSTDTLTTSAIAYPTATDTVRAEPYCFEPERDGYVEYDRESASNAVAEFCEPGKASLDENEIAGLHIRYDTGSGTTVHVRATWAEDQTACNPKERYWFNVPEDKPCEQTFDADYFCSVESPISDPGMSFSGAFVWKTEEGLCLLLMQYATKNDDDVSRLAFTRNFTSVSWGNFTHIGNNS